MKGNIIYKKTIPARSPEYAEFPKSLHPDIQDFLSGQNIKSLYTHQAEAFSHAMAGENIVITTPTASGKSLCFYLPVVQEILKDPVTRAIFIYPTKALAADQYRALIPWMEALGEHRLSVGVYDGDTPPAERKRIRERANIILTKFKFREVNLSDTGSCIRSIIFRTFYFNAIFLKNKCKFVRINNFIR